MFKVGDRVRMVQTDSCGVVAGELTTSPVDGGPRLPVRWDKTGVVNSWDPAFLRLAVTSPTNDPAEVESNGVIRRRGKMVIDPFGTLVIQGGGFSRLENSAKNSAKPESTDV